MCRIVAVEHAGLSPLTRVPPGGALSGLPEVMVVDVLVERVAGLDIGKKIVVACVRTPGSGGRWVAETRTFRSMTRSLGLMAD